MLVRIGKTIELNVNVDALPQAALDHAIYIGLRNILMDSHASITKETNPTDFVDVAKAMAEKKLATLMSGEVRVTGTRESSDPVRAEAIKIATAAVTKQIRAEGLKVADFTAASIREAALASIDDDMMELARKRVEEAKAVKPATTILSGLVKKA